MEVARGTDQAPAVAAVLRRLEEPLRVAIAGRVKAGKSTLLNALVGERLAATDAGECTRVVTWYRHALGYRVVAELRPAGTRELAFKRRDGALDIDLGGLALEAIERIEVGWPSQKLVELTLIDTPGLASANEATSERTTRALLDDETDGPGDADAVLYLMRHLHRTDVGFLEAFMDRSVAHASPINAIVVLSRADEIGARVPMRSSPHGSSPGDTGRTAGPRARVRCRPGGRLIAETGATLREAQFGWLRDVAVLPRRAGATCSVRSSASATRSSTPSARRSARNSWTGSGCTGFDWPSGCWPAARCAAPPGSRRRCSNDRASVSWPASSPSGTPRAPSHSRPDRHWPPSASSPRRSTAGQWPVPPR